MGAVAEILKGNPTVLGRSSSQGPRPLFFPVEFSDGPLQTPAAHDI